jgi:hypothetical protein
MFLSRQCVIVLEVDRRIRMAFRLEDKAIGARLNPYRRRLSNEPYPRRGVRIRPPSFCRRMEFALLTLKDLSFMSRKWNLLRRVLPRGVPRVSASSAGSASQGSGSGSTRRDGVGNVHPTRWEPGSGSIRAWDGSYLAGREWLDAPTDELPIIKIEGDCNG